MKNLATERVRCGGYWITIHKHGLERQREAEIVVPILEGDEYDLIPLVDQRHDIRTVVDVGGYVGAFSLKAKTIWPAAKVVAFEPNPDLAALYRENMEGFSGVHLFEAAAVGAGRKDTVTFNDSPDNAASFILEIVESLDEDYAMRRSTANDLMVSSPLK